METNIYPDSNGDPQVSVNGIESPEAVARGYLAAVKVIKESMNAKEDKTDD